MESTAGYNILKSLRSLVTYHLLLFLILFSISPALAKTSCEVPVDKACGDGDPWYGTIFINPDGSYNATNSTAVDLDNNLMGSVQASDCFVKIVAVRSDGDFWCLTSTGVQYPCPAYMNLKIVDTTEAFSGKYSVLGDPILYVGINPSTTPPEQTPDPDNGKYVVLDADWEILGINESHDVSEIYKARKRELPDYSIVQRIMVYTLIRGCDNIELISGIKCKNERLAQVDYDAIGGEADTVYYMNLQDRGYTPCEYFVIDYGKFYQYPGVYFVLLNKSKFGSNRGLSYFSIVGQELSNRGIARLYEESIRPNSFYDPGDSVCCRYSTVSGGADNFMCVTYEQCEACSFGASCSRTTPGFCADQTPECCGYDCSSGDVRPLRSVYSSILVWNREAGLRVLGCDGCYQGDFTCSMGSALSAYYAHPNKNVMLYPPYYPERYCGYYAEPRPSLGACNCVTGSGCGQADCVRCSRMGYGCRWDPSGGGSCSLCHYSIEPTAQPDIKFIDRTVRSIDTVVNETFVTWSEWWCNSCKKNLIGADDGPERWIKGESLLCSQIGAGGLSPISCGFYDCKVPWNCSDPMAFGTWDYRNRGGGAAYIYYTAESRLDYDDYLTDVPPTECSDYVPGSSPPYFMNDRYSKCYRDAGAWKCNCTRPEHDPKQHTPCACPSGDTDCCIEYVDFDSPQVFLVNEEKRKISSPCSTTTPSNLHCYFYGEEEAGASECVCDVTLGVCGDAYCSQSAGETPATCSSDCNSCTPQPCNSNGACEPNEHHSWCDDCLCEDPGDGCDFSTDDEDPLFCIADVYDSEYTGTSPPNGPFGKPVNMFNRCPCGDNACSPQFNENNETCPNDCTYPMSRPDDGVCWLPHGESWKILGPGCYAYIGNWDMGCALVDCPLPPGATGDGVCQYWNGEWEGGENDVSCRIATPSPGACECPVPDDVYCEDDTVCRTDRNEGDYSLGPSDTQPCADCQSCDTPCNDDGHDEYTCCDYFCYDMVGICNVPCSAGDLGVCSVQNPTLCSAGDPDQCPGSPVWVGCDKGVADPGDGSTSDETYANCPNDCKLEPPSSICDNDGECEPCYGESYGNCNDCPSNPICIVNGVCEPVFRENPDTCPQDCPVSVNNPGDCGDGVCWWDGFGAIGSSPPAWENHENCWDEPTKSLDCPKPPGYCGDLICWDYPPIKNPAYTTPECFALGYEDAECCQIDCAEIAFTGNHVCEPASGGSGGEDCQNNPNDCTFPPAKDVNDVPRDDSVCQWWAGETVSDDDACTPPTTGPTQYICEGNPPKCCACPDVYKTSAFDPSYYRISTRDSVWARTFKITPEVSNSTIKECTSGITCAQARKSLGSTVVSGGTIVITPNSVCWENASRLICDGCYGNKVDCKNCNGEDAYNAQATQCSDYKESADECMADPCDVAKVASGVKYGGCFLPPGASCTDCYTLWGEGCPAYTTDEWNCKNDPCNIGNCGWNKAAGRCERIGSQQLSCYDVCPPPTCFESECINSSAMTLDGCAFTSTNTGSACISCDDLTSCSDVAKDSCEADTCRNLKCFWDNTDSKCKDCRIITSLGGCPGYANITDCIKNPCGLPDGCAWGEEDKCVDCSFINSCQDYFKQCDPSFFSTCYWGPDKSCSSCYSDNLLGPKAYGTACYTDPCGVGPCGMVDVNKGYFETWTCLPRGDYQLGCYETVFSAHKEDQKQLCKLNAMNVTPGGCYWDLKDEACYSCLGRDVLGTQAADNDNYPIPACENYDRGRVEDNVSCIEDWCDVGPCYWDENRPVNDRCKRAFSEKPALDQTGWIRSGGRFELNPGDIDSNAGGGPSWVHSAGGADIPNYSEAWGDDPSPETDAACASYRENSIWSEMKNYPTVRKNVCYDVDDPILHACDPRTITCADGGLGGNGWFGQKSSGVPMWFTNLAFRQPKPAVGAHGGDGVDDPPYVCGTLCGKYVTSFDDLYSPSLESTTEWPVPDEANNRYMWASFNLTINETSLAGTNEMTITDIYVRPTSLIADGRGIETRGGHYGPNPLGNILPRPSQPWTIFNWFNMPETTSDGYELKDDTFNISVRGNYTVNMTLFREAKAMQCMWDSCLPRSGEERDRTYVDWCPHVMPGCLPCRTTMPPGCSATYSDPCGNSGEYANKWEHCEQWQSVTVSVAGVCVARICWCLPTDITWYYRCVACWLHEDCSYPVGPNDFTSLTSGMENVTDTSSVIADPYGENFTVSRPLTDAQSHVKLSVEGYVDVGAKFGASGHLRIKSEPDILSGFSLLVPDVIRLEHIAKQYPAEHKLDRLSIANSWDDCPTSTSQITCRNDAGATQTINCGDYRQYSLLGAGEKEGQVLTCLDRVTKRAISKFIPLRDPTWAYLYLINNPLNKYYYFIDRYDATDKNYTFRVDVVGLKPGGPPVKWADAAMNVGTFRNYHEDEMFYYDLADLYRQPRDYGLQPFEIVPGIEGAPVQKKTNIDPITLDFKTTMNGEVFYAPSDGSYTFEFWSDNIDASSINTAELILFTNYRNMVTPLIADSTSGALTIKVYTRDAVKISCTPTKADAFTTVDFSCTLDKTVPNDYVHLQFYEPYSQYSGRYNSGEVLQIKTDRSSIVVRAAYEGYYDGVPSTGDFANATLIYRTNVTSKAALSFLVRNILVLILAFFVVVGYRWFMKNRLDFEMMIKESGIYETLEDFLGLK